MAPRYFVFEFITGGGLLASGEPPAGSLLAEGQAMLAAVASDLAQASPTPATVSVLWDHRLPMPDLDGVAVCPVESAADVAWQFTRLAAEAAWTVVIAPEFGGHLEHWCQAVSDTGGRWLGGSLDLVCLAADKHATAAFLASCGISVPRGAAVGPGDAWPAEVVLPAVLKPRHGAGSIGVHRVATNNLAAAIDAAQQAGSDESVLPDEVERPWRLEAFWPGVPASVSVLAGPAGSLILPPTQQLLTGETGLQYQGGRWPLQPQLRRRAMHLAAQVATSLHQRSMAPLGYFGIDMVLGDDADGSRDAVIEVNPRFTTSYVGLRAAANVNLVAAMLHLADGADLDTLTAMMGTIGFDGRPLTFQSDGSIDRGDAHELDATDQLIEPLWVPHRAETVAACHVQEAAR